MSVNAETSAPGPQGSPEADEIEVSAACTRMARLLSRSGLRIIGVLPVTRGAFDLRRHAGGPSRYDVGPLLEHLAGALSGFAGGSTVSYVGTWRTWSGRALRGSQALVRIREVRAHVVEIVPPAQSDAKGATAALRQSLATLPAAISRVLVDLGGYAGDGEVPPAADLMEGLVTVVPRGRVARAELVRIRDRLPNVKSLGTILIG
jgi:hypothetical protein